MYFILGCLLLLLSARGFAESTNQLINLPVASVESPTFSQEELEKVQNALGIVLNREVNPHRLDEGIRSLYWQGRYQSLSVEAVPSGKKIRIIIRGSRVRRLLHIKFSNIDPEILEEIRGKVNLEEGQTTDMRTLATLKEQIKAAYESRGFYFAEIDIVVNDIPKTQDANVEVLVQPNDPTLVSRVNVRGGEVAENTLLLNLVTLRKGDRFSRLRINESIEKINRYLRANQYPTSKVEEASLGFSAGKHQVEINFLVKMGDRLQFEFTGNTILSEVELREFLTEEVLSQADVAQKVAQQIEGKYRTLGYHFCQVKIQNIRNESERLGVVRFDIREGNKVIVDDIHFSGDVEARENLKSAFFEAAPGVLQRKIYWEEGLKEATNTFRNKVENMGYLTASVSQPKSIFSEDKRGVQLFFSLELGARTLISVIDFKGASHFDGSVLISLLPFKVGEWLSPEKLREGSRTLLHFYRTHGFLDVRFGDRPGSNGFELSKDRKSATVQLRVSEGLQYFVGDVRLEGNRKTKDRVILREMKLAKEDVYNPDLVSRSEDDIALLGLFSKVEIVTSPNPTFKDRKDLKILLKESRPGIGEVGLGGAYEDPRFRLRAFLGLGYKNLLGLNHTASARGEVSLPLSRDKLIPFIEYAGTLGYRVPHPFEIPITFASQLGLDSLEISSQGPKVQTRARIEGKVEKKLSTKVTGIYRIYRYERTTTETLDQSELTRRDIIGSTGPGLVVDFRDDTFNPTKGSYHIIDVEFAHPNLLSQDDISFLMAISRNSFYFPLFSSVGLSFYVGAGYARSLFDGKPLPAARLLNDLSLGGRASLRGFSVRRFSPSENSGQTAYYNVRAEISCPLFANIGGAVFWDSGQIYPDLIPQPRHDGVGIGIRYKTPVGPLVIDLAQSIGGESEGVKFYFTVGSI